MKVNLKNKQNEKTLVNINKLFNGRNDGIQFVDDYASMILEAKRKSAGEEPATKPEVATEPTKTKTKLNKIYSLKLSEEFLNKIKNEKNINEFQRLFSLSNSIIFSKRFIR